MNIACNEMEGGYTAENSIPTITLTDPQGKLKDVKHTRTHAARE